MARHYHVDIARFAVGADSKWIDNLLSHFEIPGVERARQGLSRRISELGVYHIALIHALNRDAGFSTRSAVAIATRLLSDNQTTVPIDRELRLSLDRDVFVRRIDAAIAEAVESVALPRRGRPPRTDRSPDDPAAR